MESTPATQSSDVYRDDPGGTRFENEQVDTDGNTARYECPKCNADLFASLPQACKCRGCIFIPLIYWGR